MHYYAFETCNNTVVPFATLADAQAWIARVVPPQDYYDAAPDARSYANAYTGDGRGTRDGWRTGILADVQEQCGDWDCCTRISASAMAAQYAECYYDYPISSPRSTSAPLLHRRSPRSRSLKFQQG